MKKLRQAIESEDRARTTSQIKDFLDKCTIPDKGNPLASYNQMMALKAYLIPIDVPVLLNLIRRNEEAKHLIEGKDIVLFMGDTGSGKTTAIKRLLGYKMKKGLYNGMMCFRID